MQEIGRIQEQLKRAYEEGPWHGPSVKESLEGVTAQSAAAKTIPNAHSIWELVLHLASWTDTVSRRLNGETVESPVDFPPLAEVTDSSWKQTLADFDRAYTQLQATLANFKEGDLEKRCGPNGRTTAYVLVLGTVQHYAYHAGQISLLKKSGMANRTK